MYTLEKNNTSPLYILFKIMSQIILLLTLTLVCTLYEEFTPGIWGMSQAFSL